MRKWNGPSKWNGPGKLNETKVKIKHLKLVLKKVHVLMKMSSIN